MVSKYVAAMVAVAACLCATAVGAAQTLLDGESPAYQEAVNDVFSYLTPSTGPDGWRQPTTAATSRLVSNLTQLNDAQLIRRTNPYGTGQEVLMTNMSDFNGYSSVSYNGQPYPDMWYVAAPQVHDYLTNPLNNVDPATVAARLYQLHGMPDNRSLDRIVEFWVPETAMFRPAVNPDPNSQITSTDVVTPGSWTADQRNAYLKWMQIDAGGYSSSLPYPWSQLGYSYDWSPGASANHQGFTEFVVLGHKYTGWTPEYQAMYNNFPYKSDGEACPNVQIHAITSIGSYLYYTRDGANVGNFHVYDVCDTLWVGSTYTPVAADPANRSVVIDDTGLVCHGMHVSSAGFTVTNRGIIMGTRYGIDKQYYSDTVRFSDSGTLDNYGAIVATLSGASTAVSVDSGSNAALTIHNYGTILGNITLANGNNTIASQGGTILGEISAGTGTNTFVAEANSQSLLVGSLRNFETVQVHGTLAGIFNVAATTTTVGSVTTVSQGTVTNNGGALSPGLSSGALGTISAAAYKETKASAFDIDIAAPGTTPGRLNTGGLQSCDLVAINGSAILNGQSTVRVGHVSGSENAYQVGDSFYFLTASNITVGGSTPQGKTSLAATTDSAFLAFEVWGAVDREELHLRVANVTPFASAATGANEIAMAGALDGDISTAAGFHQAIQRLGPDVYHSVDASMRRTTQYMTDSWADYLHSRCGRCLCSPGETNEADAENRAKFGYGKDWNVFAQPFGMFYHERTSGDRVGFDANTSGVEMLVDRWLRDDLIAGLGVGYGQTSLGFDDRYGDGTLHVLRVGPYLSFCEENWFLDAMATYGYHDNDVDRNTVSNGTYQSDYGSNDVSLYTAIGRNYRQAKSVVSPLVSLQYIYLQQDAFTETGPGSAALHMAANDLNSLRSRVGMRVHGCYTLGRLPLTPEVSVGWAHEYLATDRLVSSFAAGQTPFETTAGNVFRDSGYVGMGLTMHVRTNMQVYCRYDGEFAGTGSFHGVNGGLAFSR